MPRRTTCLAFEWWLAGPSWSAIASGLRPRVTADSLYVMEGFLGLRRSPARVRLATRLIAIVPAVVALAVAGDASTVTLLVATQVVLSLQLPFAVVPLIAFTASRRIMGSHASHPAVTLTASVAAVLIIACNAWLVAQLSAAQAGAALTTALTLAAALGAALLAYLAVAPFAGRTCAKHALTLSE